MLLRRFYDTGLAQASYLIGCGVTGEALVVDANRDVQQYERAAAAENLRITHVTETHIHADFVSGSRELAARTGARLLLSGEGGPDWQYSFAAGDGATLLHDGDSFHVGNVRIDVLHTPGHTPEHLTLLITDTPATDRPMGALTGDFIFAGDVGRPDLLERAAGIQGTMDTAARTLFRSLQRFRTLPDYLQLWPGHGAGSACGKALGAVPSTTLGYEKIANWGLVTDDQDEFVRMVLAGQPEPPRYFAEMKRINREGPPVLGRIPRPPRTSLAELRPLLEQGASVVDIRSAVSFAARHIPGTINIPLTRSFTTWAGSLLPYDQPMYVLADDDAAMQAAVRELALIGLDHVAGWMGRDAVEKWEAAGLAVGSIPQISVPALAAQLRADAADVLDVRGRAEWEVGHLPGVPNVPLPTLEDYLASESNALPHGRPLVVHCQGGTRSAIAASLLHARGFRNVVNLTDGFGAWQAAGEPVERAAGGDVPEEANPR